MILESLPPVLVHAHKRLTCRTASFSFHLLFLPLPHHCEAPALATMSNSTVGSSSSIYEVPHPRWPRLNEPNLDRVFAPQDNGDDKDNDGAISGGASSFVYDRHDFFLGYWGDDVKPPQHFEEVNCEERPLLGMCSGHSR